MPNATQAAARCATYTSPRDRMLRRWRPAGCTGMMRYSLCMPRFASTAPAPNCQQYRTAPSARVYMVAHYSAQIPSLTLPPRGDDRLNISRHRPGWPDLGLTPKGLKRTSCVGAAGTGPTTLPAASSPFRYSSTTAEYSRAEWRLRRARARFSLPPP